MSAAQPSQPQIALTLLDLKRQHQEARTHVGHGADEVSEAVLEEIEDMATETLRLVVAVHGWPGHSLVGEVGADAAWWIAHHSADRTFQRHALALLEEAVKAGEATRKQLAFLTDRCRVMADQPQLYGTQFSYGPAGVQAYAVQDPERLDARRAEMGLEPFDAFDELVRALYLPPASAPPPPDSTAG
ncbi:DUF6624 domain-containing protein [Streptomyces noursei]|uniref:DUF6624 domain-containing protein n=1 Tax=Streptomyces noursei TaxID=1971 RepID=UPI001962C22D|nr:DUF6624 domain-containing protein [Streptomyces noursei]QRX94796.1 hypothetical protein JNO44_31645 [Streptomyces noursei]